MAQAPREYALELTEDQKSVGVFLQGVPRQANPNNTLLYVKNPPQKHYKVTITGIEGQTSDFIREIQIVLLLLGMVCWNVWTKKLDAVTPLEMQCDRAVAYFHGLELNGVLLSALKSEYFPDEIDTDSDNDEENELSD